MRLLTFLVLFNIHSGLMAQTEYFSVLDMREENLSSACYNIIVEEEGYTVAGVRNTELNGWVFEINNWSSEGDFISELGQPSEFNLLNYAEAFIKSESGYIQSSSRGVTTWGTKFDENGEQEWSIQLGDSMAFSTEFHVCHELEDGSVIFSGPKFYNPDDDPWPNYSHMFLTKVSSEGDTLWTQEHVIAEDKFLRVNGIFELENGDLLFSGGVYQDWDNFLVKTNNEGTIVDPSEDMVFWGNPQVSEFLPWLVEEDESDVFTVAYLQSSAWASEAEDGAISTLHTATFDAETMTLGLSESESDQVEVTYIMDFTKTPDGGYAMLCQDWSTAPINSFIRKLGPDLEEEWLTYYQFSEDTDGANWLFDIEVTPDGGFVCVGSASGNNFIEHPQRTWLLKLDACGDMEWQGCTNSVEESIGSGFGVYPNPASNRITVSLNSTILLNNTHAIFRNNLGQEVFATQITASEQELDVSGLANGIYMLSLVSDGRMLHSERVVIE